ncbi:hypothetical protein KIN20_010530 [Parelaphostrongylus tenuis]|uniref:Mos1 transposase HTH domain-containing protein n=1 Tax=Parelaphostrongylus tenuis TaxID=148309 RepID=A0AAD5MZ52_PARTN|nr:hypothetical protein KIN20_010530 [Parelaphostrongylus tenuis]
MELTSEQIRLLMVHEWPLNSNATVASERINQACGEDTVDKSTVYRWFKKFDEVKKVLKISRAQVVQKKLIVKVCLKRLKKNSFGNSDAG